MPSVYATADYVSIYDLGELVASYRRYPDGRTDWRVWRLDDEECALLLYSGTSWDAYVWAVHATYGVELADQIRELAPHAASHYATQPPMEKE